MPDLRILSRAQLGEFEILGQGTDHILRTCGIPVLVQTLDGVHPSRWAGQTYVASLPLNNSLGLDIIDKLVLWRFRSSRSTAVHNRSSPGDNPKNNNRVGSFVRVAIKPIPNPNAVSHSLLFRTILRGVWQSFFAM